MSFISLVIIFLSAQSASAALTATPNPFTLTNSTIDVGQISFANTIITGGTGTYTGNWLFSQSSGNVISGNTVSSPILGSGSLSLVANAVSSNTLTLTYNGVARTLSSGSNTIFGTWSFNAFAQDTGSPANTVTTLGNTLTINPQLTGTPTATLYATNYDVGQAFNMTCTTNTVTGGTQYGGTYFFQTLVYNAVSNALVYGNLNSRQGSTQGYCGKISAPLSTAGINPGTYYMVDQLADDATTPEIADSAHTGNVVIYANPTVTQFSLASTGTTYDVGQTVTYNVIVANGIGPFTINLTTNGAVANSISGVSAGTPTLISNVIASTSDTSFNVIVTDKGSANAGAATYYTFNSVSNTITVNSALLAPAAPAVNATKLDVNQALGLTDHMPSTGTPTYGGDWRISTNGGAYLSLAPTPCNSFLGAVSGAAESCDIPANTLTAGDTYSFKLRANDSASTPDTNISAASANVVVSSALTAPSAPTVSATKLDANQALTVNGIIPSTGTSTYTWQFLTSINGGAFTAANAIAVCPTSNNGIGASASATESCSVSANTLTGGDTYAFEFKVTDSANTPETQTSSASSNVVVASALTAPSAPTVSATKLDANQALTVNGIIPSTGTSTYTWQFLTSINGGAFTAANAIAVCPTSNNAIGASASATESCSVSANTLTGGNTYAFEFKVTDSASTPETQTSSASSNVVVSSVLTAPSAPVPNLTSVVSNRALTVNGITPSTGTSPYSWQWFYSIGGNYSSANGICATGSGTGASVNAVESCIASNTLTGGNTYTFELQVTDSANTPETQTSPASSGVVVMAPGGAGGGGPKSTTSTTSTTTSTSTTLLQTTTASTTVPTTTITQRPVINTNNNSVTVNVSAGNNERINFTARDVNVTVTSNSSTPQHVNVSIMNVTPLPPAPSNYSVLLAFNISAPGASMLNVTLHYNCAAPSSRIAPYIYRNGAWQEIEPFSVNVSACTISFSMPADPIVGVFSTPTLTTTTTVQTTVPTTSAAYTSTIAQAPATQSNTPIYAAVAVVIILAVVVAAYLSFRKKGRR